jgi:hypothetical protein
MATCVVRYMAPFQMDCQRDIVEGMIECGVVCMKVSCRKIMSGLCDRSLLIMWRSLRKSERPCAFREMTFMIYEDW